MSGGEIEQGDKLTPAGETISILFVKVVTPYRKTHTLLDFEGVTSRRHCTDVICTILLWIMWLSMTGLGIYAYQNGDYRLILYPLDYAGNICGMDYGMDMREYPYLFYVNDFSGGVCVKVRGDYSSF